MSRRVTRSSMQSTQVPPLVDQQTRARWTNSLTRIFADMLVDQVRQGNRLSDSKSFTKQVWDSMSDRFYRKTGLRWETEQLKSRYLVMRKLYLIVKPILDREEFSFDESTGKVLGSDEAWADYLKENPEAEPVKINGCSIYKQLCLIFSVSVFNGNNGVIRGNDGGIAQEAEVPLVLGTIPVDSCKDDSPAGTEGNDDMENAGESFVDTTIVNTRRNSQRIEFASEAEGDQSTYRPAKSVSSAVNRKRTAAEMDGKAMTNSSNPRQSAIQGNVNANMKKGRKGVDDSIAAAILQMANASKLRTAAIKHINSKFSIADCVKELDQIQGLEQEIYFAALELFNDRNAREFFLSLSGEKRLTWLRNKCTVQSGN